jgi:hypothetical protein
MSARKFRSIALLGSLVVLVAVPSTVDANHSWNGYHWARTSNPFTVRVIDSMTSNWDDNLGVAISDWAASSVLNVSKESGNDSQSTRKRCRPVSGKVRACNANYGNNGWLGIAQIWITGGTHITQGTTKVNDSYFTTATYNKPAWRRLVMCQEVAHDFGLDHQDENFNNANLGSCMDYTSDPDGPPTNEHPNSHDFQQIVSIYTHLDSFTTIGAATPGPGASADVDHPAQWGRLVRSSRNGRVQVYELDFGRGNKVITHVFWADPQADTGRGR